jgi:hypothetical protein
LPPARYEQAKKDEEFKRQQYVAQQEQAKRDEDYRQQLLAQQEKTEAISYRGRDR